MNDSLVRLESGIVSAQRGVMFNGVVVRQVGEVKRAGVVVSPDEVGEVVWDEEAELLIVSSSASTISNKIEGVQYSQSYMFHGSSSTFP